MVAVPRFPNPVLLGALVLFAFPPGASGEAVASPAPAVSSPAPAAATPARETPVEAEIDSAAATAAGPTLVLAEMNELTELRVKTDRMRGFPDGRREPVYELRRPDAGNTFVNLRVYLADLPPVYTLAGDEIRLVAPDGAAFTPFDWFQEAGLEERRGALVPFDNQGILSATFEVPREGKDALTLHVKDVAVASLGEDRAAAKAGLQFITDRVEELAELRVKTDRMRDVPGGGREPVYELRKPGAGKAFVHFRLLVVNEGGPVDLELQDLRVESPVESGKRHLPFDWFLEVGMEELRGAVLAIPERTILNFTVELPREGMLPLRVLIAGQDLGTVGELFGSE